MSPTNSEMVKIYKPTVLHTRLPLLTELWGTQDQESRMTETVDIDSASFCIIFEYKGDRAKKKAPVQRKLA